MWALLIALAITYLMLWFIPYWLVWPVGVLFSLYLVTLIQRRRSSELTDRQILAVIVGSWLAACWGLCLFLLC